MNTITVKNKTLPVARISNAQDTETVWSYKIYNKAFYQLTAGYQQLPAVIASSAVLQPEKNLLKI